MSRGYPSMTAVRTPCHRGYQTGTRLQRCSVERRAILLILLPPRRRVAARRHSETSAGYLVERAWRQLSGGLRELMDAFRQKGQG